MTGSDKRAPSPVEVIRFSIHSRAMLAACYMPAIRGGGLFVPTDEAYELGDEVCLAVSIMNEPLIPVMGRVVWITPEGAVGHRTQGIGVQFDDDDHARLLVAHIAHFLPPAGQVARSHTF